MWKFEVTTISDRKPWSVAQRRVSMALPMVLVALRSRSTQQENQR
jgi:hypothetical protein